MSEQCLLDSAQMQAIQHINGPFLCIAGNVLKHPGTQTKCAGRLSPESKYRPFPGQPV